MKHRERKQERGRKNDREFLAVLRVADADTLDRLVWESKRWAPWRRVAIARAVARLGATT